MKRWQDTGLRISQRILARGRPKPRRPRERPLPGLAHLNAAAASGELCASGHHWDRVWNYVWQCRRCGALTRKE